MKKIIPHRIVLIADRIKGFENITIATDNLEFIEDDYFNDVIYTLRNVSRGVVHYNSPADFMNHIHKHSNDIVFPIWSGQNSRNRRALIPSICEAYKIRFVGADTYTNIICQDKAMSKEFCRKQNIVSANYILYNDYFQPESITSLKLPLVVKPNFEGGSIGISQFNLVDEFSKAIELAKNLYSLHQQDVSFPYFSAAGM